MAKIYGTPIMAGGAGGANKDLPPLLDNFKAIKGGGTRLKDLPNGTKVKFGTYNSQTLVWRIAQNEGVTKAVLDLDYDTGKTVIGDMVISPANSICGNWAITGWLNATEAGGSWWANRVHYEDSEYPETEPTYSSQDGFLHGWSESDRGILQNIEWNLNDLKREGYDEPYQLTCRLMTSAEDEVNAAWNGERFCVGFGMSPVILRDYGEGGMGYSGLSGMGSGTMEGAVSDNELSSAIGIWPACAPNPEAVVSDEPDDDGCYTIDYDAFYVTIQADKMLESRANELAGAVWVYGDHEPTSVNDGTKIQLTREEVVTSDGGEAQTITKTVEWNNEANFFARQFTYNSKKQYQTMLEGAIATITLVGVPEPVSELAEQHSGSSITLTWKNPTSDEFYDHTVVVYKTDAFPTSIDDGTQGYSGTDETATLSGLELGSTYYIAVFTVSAYGLYGEPQTVQVEIPAGQLLSSLASGTKVKLGKWNNTDLQWKVARDTSDQSIRLVLEPTSVSLLGNKMWDNKEPSNSDSNRRKYGNNRYIYSNIHQWLNATEATGWYTAQHSTDAAPDYSSQAGFLSGWSENHIAALDRATLTVSRSSTDGGGTETFVSRVALMSTTELGLESGTGNGRLDIFNSDGNRATGSVYWTRTPHPSSANSVRPVNKSGALYVSIDAHNANGVRPLCSPVSTALVSLEMDDDNCYVVQ